MTEPQDPRPNYPVYPGASPTPPGSAPVQPSQGPPASYPQQPGVVQQGGGRPGTVLAACLITIVLSGLTMITSAVIFAARNDVVRSTQNYLRDNRNELNIKASDMPVDADIRSALTGVAVVFVIVGLIGVTLGIATLFGQNWARILLIVTSSLTAICAILPSLGFVGLPWLIGSITVIVLLLTGRAKEWFAAPRTA